MSPSDPEARGFTMYGPGYTFLGVPRADLADPASLAGADVVVVGAPFDGGTSHRPGARFGPSAIRGRRASSVPNDSSSFRRPRGAPRQ